MVGAEPWVSEALGRGGISLGLRYSLPASLPFPSLSFK